MRTASEFPGADIALETVTGRLGATCGSRGAATAASAGVAHAGGAASSLRDGGAKTVQIRSVVER